MKNETTFRGYFYLLLFVAMAWAAHGQVPVAIAPSPHPQFFTSSGLPLSGGFLYTYIAGTTTLSNTYADSTGTVQNPDPIPLDVSGAPSNGTAQTGIWLSNQAFKFCAYNSSMVQQWCTDNVTSYFQLLNFANTWTFQQTFSLPIIDLSADNQFVLGAPGVQTTLDFPPPAGPVTLHFPNTADTVVGRATTDTLTNKTLASPTVTGLATGLSNVIYKNVNPVTHTGSVAEDAIYTVPVPALVVGQMLRITFAFFVTTQGAVSTSFTSYVDSNAVAGSAYGSNMQTSGIQSTMTIANLPGGAIGYTANSFNENALTGFPTSSLSNFVASSLFTSPSTLTIKFRNGALTDSQKFYYILVEVL